MVYVHESAPRRRIMDESEILELSTSPNHGTKEVTDREIIASFWKGDNRTLQYFSLPHRFLPESSGILRNGSGIHRNGTGILRNPQE